MVSLVTGATHSEGITQGATLVTGGHRGGEASQEAPHLPLGTEDLQCPICQDQLQDAFVTTCGHTFCYACITAHLKHKRNCPNCSAYLTTEHIHPNFLLNKILNKVAAAPSPWQCSLPHAVERALQEAGTHVSTRELDAAISALQSARQTLADQEASSGLHILLLLLQDARRRKEALVEELKSQIQVLERDLSKVAQEQQQQQRQRDQVLVTSLPRSAQALEQQLQAAAATALASGATLHVHTLDANGLASLTIPACQVSDVNTAQLARVLHVADTRPAELNPTRQPTPPPSVLQASRPSEPQAGTSAANGFVAQETVNGVANGVALPGPSGAHEAQAEPQASGSGREQQQLGNGKRSRELSNTLLAAGPGRPVSASAPQHRIDQLLAPPAAVAAGAAGSGAAAGSSSGAAQAATRSVLGVRPHSWSGLDDDGNLRAAKKRLMLTQFEDLEKCYLSLRASNSFQEVLSGATTFSRMVRTAEIPRAAQGGPSAPAARTQPPPRPGARASTSNFVSCIEFNTSGSLFATCSPQRICLWDYAAVLQAAPDQQLAKGQLQSKSRLTCLAFGRTHSNTLASSDSEGQVCLYDVHTLDKTLDLEAHDTRVWALDFAPAVGEGAAETQAHCFASGSDDYTVKVWDCRDGRACSTIDTRANVCSVRYNPWDGHYLAVGSAAHAVMVYDLRKAGGATPALASLSGHGKAVSYVRWASRTELVSASTDSSLRLWDLSAAVAAPGAASSAAGGSGACGCVRTYTGHVNERNFVGLSVHRDLIAAGSEANEVVVYYKPLASPAMRHALSPGPAAGSSRTSQPGSSPFVSSLTWHSEDTRLVVSSSQGSVYVLTLQT